MTLHETLNQAVWVARSLYDRGKTSGSSANLSVRYQEDVYITCSGSCFGTMTEADFAQVSINGAAIGGPKPSKELPLHLSMYQKSREIGAVIHTHSTYATLWSCLRHPDENDLIPAYTPYLGMKLGKIALVPYAMPGSEALFHRFHAKLGEGDGYLLRNHGPIVAGSDIMDAYFRLEELEESAKLAWLMRNEPEQNRLTIY